MYERLFLDYLSLLRITMKSPKLELLSTVSMSNLNGKN